MVLLLGFLALVFASVAFAHALETQQQQEMVLKDIGIDERPGNTVPLSSGFKDQYGRPLDLEAYLGKGPALLSLNYYGCPMLCPVTFAALARSLNDMKALSPGKDFKLLTVSINPDDGPAQARARADETYAMLKLPGASGWWAFLSGDDASIKAVAKAVGFRFKSLGGGQYAHPTVLIVLTPKGKVSRYLYGIEHDPAELRLALLEAADGKIGRTPALNRLILFCYHYDPVGKKYQLFALNIAKVLGACVIIGLIALLLPMMLRERSKRPSKGNDA
ncbi:MAG: SCO family protein [Nitrospirota bacterium]